MRFHICLIRILFLITTSNLYTICCRICMPSCCLLLYRLPLAWEVPEWELVMVRHQWVVWACLRCHLLACHLWGLIEEWTVSWSKIHGRYSLGDIRGHNVWSFVNISCLFLKLFKFPKFDWLQELAELKLENNVIGRF